MASRLLSHTPTAIASRLELRFIAFCSVASKAAPETDGVMQIVVDGRVLMQSRDLDQMHRLKNRVAQFAARRPRTTPAFDAPYNRQTGRFDVVLGGLTVGDAGSKLEAEQVKDAALRYQREHGLSLTELAQEYADELDRRAQEDTHVLSDQAFEANVAAGRAYLHTVPAQMADWDAETADDALESVPATPLLCISAWYGSAQTPVEIVKETKQRYLIKATQDMTLIPGGRHITTGETVYVPKHLVRHHVASVQEAA